MQNSTTMLVIESKKNYLEALVLFKEAAKVQPDDIGAHINIGRTLNFLERFNEAETAYRLFILKASSSFDSSICFQVSTKTAFEGSSWQKAENKNCSQLSESVSESRQPRLKKLQSAGGCRQPVQCTGRPSSGGATSSSG